MVYNGQGEIGLALAYNLWQKRLVLAGHLKVAIKLDPKFQPICKVKFNGHPQESRHGHLIVSQKCRVHKVAVIRWPL